MSWFAAPLALVLAVTVTETPLPRLTHAEGVVTANAAGVRTGGGRAEIALPDGSIVHVDTTTAVSYPNDASLRLDDGRVVVRTRGAVDVDSPSGRIEIEPHSVAIILVDRPGGRLLVSVPAGALALRTRYASITRVVAGQSAMMPSATSVPWATAYTRVQIDAFTLWSDARAASTGAGVAAADWVASDLSAVAAGTTPPCTGYPSWSAPCWVLPAPSPSRHRPGAPVQPPSYAPNYTPNFTTQLPAEPPATRGAARPPRPVPNEAPSSGTKPAPTPAARPPAPAVRGSGGAVRVPERPPSP